MRPERPVEGLRTHPEAGWQHFWKFQATYIQNFTRRIVYLKEGVLYVTPNMLQVRSFFCWRTFSRQNAAAYAEKRVPHQRASQTEIARLTLFFQLADYRAPNFEVGGAMQQGMYVSKGTSAHQDNRLDVLKGVFVKFVLLNSMRLFFQVTSGRRSLTRCTFCSERSTDETFRARWTGSLPSEYHLESCGFLVFVKFCLVFCLLHK